MKSGISLSTLRRHIKANKIPYRIENGRYLLQLPQDSAPRPVTPTAAAAPTRAAVPSAPAAPGAGAHSEARELRQRLQRAQEEIAELKMLVALYEEKIAQQKSTQPTAARPLPLPPRFNG